jgi:hypothetical protein
VILLARPAAGKSEIIDFLRGCPLEERIERFRMGKLRVIDDFPMLWTWFEEDKILEEMGLPRLHTSGDGYFLVPELWHLLIRRLCLEYRKMLADQPDLHGDTTVVIEFSRGSEHGGYREAFAHLDAGVVARAGVLYVDVSYEESLRKNRRRFNPSRPHSILEHGLPDDKMERLYRTIDWEEISADDPDYLRIADHRVPYAVFDNRDDVTTSPGPKLAKRLEEATGRLWALRKRMEM